MKNTKLFTKFWHFSQKNKFIFQKSGAIAFVPIDIMKIKAKKAAVGAKTRKIAELANKERRGKSYLIYSLARVSFNRIYEKCATVHACVQLWYATSRYDLLTVRMNLKNKTKKDEKTEERENNSQKKVRRIKIF